jgi:hypothetical protein
MTDNLCLNASEFESEVESSVRWNIAYSAFFVTRNSDFSIRTWRVAEKILGQVFRTKRPASFRRNVYLCSVYSSASSQHYGYWIPPEAVIMPGSRLTFTFFLKGHSYFAQGLDNLDGFSYQYLGNRTYIWKVRDSTGESLFLTTSSSMPGTSGFDLPNHLMSNIRYLFHAINLYVYSLFSGRIESPLLPHHNWQNSDIIEQIDALNPLTIITRTRLMDLVPIVRSKPFSDWFYCGDIYLRQPNLLSPELITNKALFYLLGFIVNFNLIYLTKDTWNAVVDMSIANKIQNSFVALASVLGETLPITDSDTRRLSYNQLLVLTFFVDFNKSLEHKIISLRTEHAILDFLSNIYFWLTVFLDKNNDKIQYLLSTSGSIDGVTSTILLLSDGKNPFGDPLIDWTETDFI